MVAARIDHLFEFGQRPSRNIARESASYDVVALDADPDVRGIVDACEQFLRLERDNRNEIPERKERIEVVSELLEAAQRAR